jgi:hypothetical protein
MTLYQPRSAFVVVTLLVAMRFVCQLIFLLDLGTV